MTPTPPPQLSVAQRQAALEKAKISRQERAEVKRLITLGEMNIFDAINDPRESIRRMKVIELLSALPGVGKARATLIMERRNISPTRRIGGLGHLQLKALGKELAVAKVDPVRGKLIVISGPGGVGKSTITAQLRNDPRFWISVSATTRDPRPGEREGVDYLFLTPERFQEMIEVGEFLEWAEFAGNRYGTPRGPVEEWRTLGKHVILEIEIDGARQVRAREAGATLIFIAPPSWEELVRRLTSRGTDSPERRAARLALAEQEMAAASEFDAILVNEHVEGLIEQLVSLATA
ncbi:MAG: guanylate kinase [Actinomycetes bacterium]